MNPNLPTLIGQHVRLEPLDLRHAADLAKAGAEREIWDYMPIAAPRSVEEMELAIQAAQAACAKGERMPFAVIDLRTGCAVGSTSYLDISVENRRIEIGWTWLGAAARRTAINTECKYLLFGHAFEMRRCGRVQLKCDGRNLRSQAAIERIGAKREGVLRQHMIMPNGFVRDTVMFSVVAAEWPEVKRRLESILTQR